MHTNVGIPIMNDKYMTSKILTDSENLLLSKLTLSITLLPHTIYWATQFPSDSPF